MSSALPSYSLNQSSSSTDINKPKPIGESTIFSGFNNMIYTGDNKTLPRNAVNDTVYNTKIVGSDTGIIGASNSLRPSSSPTSSFLVDDLLRNNNNHNASSFMNWLEESAPQTPVYPTTDPSPDYTPPSFLLDFTTDIDNKGTGATSYETTSTRNAGDVMNANVSRSYNNRGLGSSSLGTGTGGMNTTTGLSISSRDAYPRHDVKDGDDLIAKKSPDVFSSRAPVMTTNSLYTINRDMGVSKSDRKVAGGSNSKHLSNKRSVNNKADLSGFAPSPAVSSPSIMSDTVEGGRSNKALKTKTEPFLMVDSNRSSMAAKSVTASSTALPSSSASDDKLFRAWSERLLVSNDGATGSKACGTMQIIYICICALVPYSAYIMYLYPKCLSLCFIDFTVMSWNVLASYISEKSSWETRRDLILKEILWRKPDLLFLQELQLRDTNNICDKHTNHAAWFRTTLLEHGYDGYYNKKVRGSSTVLIAWKKAKFTSQGVWSDFNNLQQNVTAGGPSSLLDQVEKLSKKRVLFVILKHLATRKRVITCSLHASAPIIDTKLANHLPLLDAAGAMSELDLAAHYMSTGGFPLPIIMGADLNAQVDAVARKFVVSGRVVPYDNVYLSASKFGCELPPIGHNLAIASAYETVLGKEGKRTYIPHTYFMTQYSIIHLGKRHL